MIVESGNTTASTDDVHTSYNVCSTKGNNDHAEYSLSYTDTTARKVYVCVELNRKRKNIYIN